MARLSGVEEATARFGYCDSILACGLKPYFYRTLYILHGVSKRIDLFKCETKIFRVGVHLIGVCNSGWFIQFSFPYRGGVARRISDVVQNRLVRFFVSKYQHIIL